MSHRIEARCKITDRNYLIQAIQALGWTFSEARNGEIKLGNGSLSLTQNQDGTWNVTGDPYYDDGKLRRYYNNTPKLLADIQYHYNKVMAGDKLSQLGYYLSQQEETTEELTLVFDNWV